MELISREEAIGIVDRECREFRGIFGRIEDAIKALPVESRPKGKWEASTNGTDYRVCSNCLYERHAGTKYNYCPICGADMRGEKE